MRTDSPRVSDDALAAVREHIAARYGSGSDVLPESPRFFRGKRDVQDAHEAIRPTDLSLPPEEVAKHVSSEEAKLYSLMSVNSRSRDVSEPMGRPRICSRVRRR